MRLLAAYVLRMTGTAQRGAMSLLSDEYTGTVRWPRLRQDVAIVTWSSFLVACVATMLCFAFIDPVLVGNDDYPPPAFASRMTGYASASSSSG